MLELDAATLAAYVAAAGALILVPGQDTLVVLTRGFASRAAGVGAAVGVAAGVLLHATAAALGLATVYRAVPPAATLVTLGGAAYLLWLAADTARGDGVESNGAAATPRADGAGSARTAGAVAGLRRGFLTNVANPKVALFFLAFLPGFAGSGPDAPARMALLGATYAGLTAAYLGVVAVASGRVGRALSSATRVHWLGGGAMIVLGVALAVE